MKILYGIGFTDEEKSAFRVDIIGNIVDGIKALILGMDKLGLTYEVNHQFKWFCFQNL